MSERIVAKAGGTSNATPEAVNQSMAWAEQSDIFVVSAPGKIEGDEPYADKITNQLLRAHQLYEQDGSVSPDVIDNITSRFAAIVDGLDSARLTGKWIDAIGKRVVNAAKISEDASSMLGEQLQSEIYKSAGFKLLDPSKSPQDIGDVPDAWREWLSDAYTEGQKYVLPGNVTKAAWRLMSFGRGGSDISGGLAAYGIHADLNVNLTDGCAMSADPRLIESQRLQPIEHMLYAEARELGRNGTGLVHPSAMVPLMRGDIPTEIRSTFDSAQSPTLLDNNQERASHREGNIVALSLMRDVVIHKVHEPGMAEASGRLAQFESGFAGLFIPIIDSQGDGVDGQKYFVQAEDKDASYEAIAEVLNHGTIDTKEDVDLITLVGNNLQSRYFDHILDLMLSSGIDIKEWQGRGHDVSHGKHSIRVSVDHDKSKGILDRIHAHYLEKE